MQMQGKLGLATVAFKNRCCLSNSVHHRYLYFRYLANLHDIDMSGFHFILKHESAEDGAFQSIVESLQTDCLPAWRKQAFDEDVDDLEAFSIKFRKHLPVHFSIISSEYHLCQLNEIHVRSPGQSPLRALGGWMRASVDTTWSYQYSSVNQVTLDARQHPIRSFLTKQYQTVQRLIPVIHNLRGVVANREFFQRDSYRVLVAARRSLVADMERFYSEQPSLKHVNQFVSQVKVSSNDRQMDAILEDALLNLGRCLDLARPAGLLTGPVSANDWRLSLRCLEEAVSQVTRNCDPDYPLPTESWADLRSESPNSLLPTSRLNQTRVWNDGDRVRYTMKSLTTRKGKD